MANLIGRVNRAIPGKHMGIRRLLVQMKNTKPSIIKREMKNIVSQKQVESVMYALQLRVLNIVSPKEVENVMYALEFLPLPVGYTHLDMKLQIELAHWFDLAVWNLLENVIHAFKLLLLFGSTHPTMKLQIEFDLSIWNLLIQFLKNC